MYKINNRIIIVFLEMIYVIFFVACAHGKSYHGYCVINNNDSLEYLKFVPVFKLYLNNPKIKLPTPSTDYIIPDINHEGRRVMKKLGLQLDICPPVLLSADISCETCFNMVYK